MKTSTPKKFGTLVNYKTGADIRPALKRERAYSAAAAKKDGGAGVILVDGVLCYVS